jgi:hypothetical protein
MVTYKLSPVAFGQQESMSVVRSDGWGIPFDPANTDYQAFLAWKAEGNEPLPADDNGQAAE